MLLVVGCWSNGHSGQMQPFRPVRAHWSPPGVPIRWMCTASAPLPATKLSAGCADPWDLRASARAFEWRLACKGAGEQGGPGGGTPPGCGSVLRVPAAA